MRKEEVSGFLRFVRVWFKLWLATNPPQQHLQMWLAEIGKIRASIKRELK